MSNKKQGQLKPELHLIGDRTPIVQYFAIGGMVVTLAGCDTGQADYFAFRDIKTCESTLPTQCEAAYKKAENQAMKVALKYMEEDECNIDFGLYCVENNGIWTPKIAGFITHRSLENEFTQPFFTTFNPMSSMYGKAFMADGREIADLRDTDGLNLQLKGKYEKYFPESKLDNLQVKLGKINDIDQESNSSNNNSSGSVLNTAITAYVMSEMIDEAGDVLTEREKNKRYGNYRECIQKGYTDCNKYKVGSGTARIGKTNSTSNYKSNSKLEDKAAKTKNTYKQQKTVKTKSSGGFGTSGRSFGGFGS